MEDIPTLSRPSKRKSIFSLFFDSRVQKVITQIIFIAILFFICYLLYQNVSKSMQKTGVTLGYSFLNIPAGFAINDRMIDYTADSSNLRAIQVGLMNSVLVSVIGIVLSTILGILVGVALLSANFLLRKISTVYVEVLRNIPLLLAILATYSVIIYSLPRVQKAFNIGNSIFISNRGVVVPTPVPSETNGLFMTILLVSLICIIGVAFYFIKFKRKDSWIVSILGLVGLLVVGLLAWFIITPHPFTFDIPFKKGLNFTGGKTFSPELFALIVGLVLGSSPYIADTVRAGIQSVSKGQLEAAQALGLNGYQIFRKITFPQAMRVIIPPMTSNYLGITKNSSLAAAIAYPDLFGISGTIIMQTGRAMEMMLLVMVCYATLSLLTSLFMNWYNNRVRLVER